MYSCVHRVYQADKYGSGATVYDGGSQTSGPLSQVALGVLSRGS